MTARGRIFLFIIGAAFLALIALRFAAGFIVDWRWFASLGYVGVFWTTVKAKLVLFAVAFVPTAIVLYANAAVAQRFAGFRPALRSVPSPWNSIEGLTPPAMIERLGAF